MFQKKEGKRPPKARTVTKMKDDFWWQEKVKIKIALFVTKYFIKKWYQNENCRYGAKIEGHTKISGSQGRKSYKYLTP